MGLSINGFSGALPGLAVILPGWIFLPAFFDAVFQIAGYCWNFCIYFSPYD